MTGDYVYKNQATHFRVLKSKEEINFCYLIITCDESKKITCISSWKYHQILFRSRLWFESLNSIGMFEES